MTKKTVGLCLLTLLLGCALGYFAAPKGVETSKSTGAKSAAGKAPASVIVAQPILQAFPKEVSAVGSLRSAEAVTVRPEVAGKVVKLAFQEGQKVSQGQVLLQLDASVLQAELAQAQANLVLAKSKLERVLVLAEQGSISVQALDEAENIYRVQKASVDLAQAQLSKMTIRSPFAGKIGLRSVAVGDYVQAGADLVTIESNAGLKVDFRVPEIYAQYVASNQILKLSIDALTELSPQAKVYAVSPVVDVSGRALELRAQLTQAYPQLRPGMFARVRLQVEQGVESFVIAETALVPESGGQFVFVVEQGKARKVAIKIGQRRDGLVQVLSGLNANDSVVIEGIQKARDGAPVTIITPKV